MYDCVASLFMFLVTLSRLNVKVCIHNLHAGVCVHDPVSAIRPVSCVNKLVSPVVIVTEVLPVRVGIV